MVNVDVVRSCGFVVFGCFDGCYCVVCGDGDVSILFYVFCKGCPVCFAIVCVGCSVLDESEIGAGVKNYLDGFVVGVEGI